MKDMTNNARIRNHIQVEEVSQTVCRKLAASLSCLLYFCSQYHALKPSQQYPSSAQLVRQIKHTAMLQTSSHAYAGRASSKWSRLACPQHHVPLVSTAQTSDQLCLAHGTLPHQWEVLDWASAPAYTRGFSIWLGNVCHRVNAHYTATVPLAESLCVRVCMLLEVSQCA
jgi:hypothetical protein